MNRPERKAAERARWTKEKRAAQAEQMRKQALEPGAFRDKVHERMTTNNPAQNPETQAKITAKLKGRTFLARGGNSKLTTQQQKIAILFPAARLECPIGIPREIAAQVESAPKCYKVDLGFPEVRLAVEIDGKTHLTRKWRFLDKRKEQILALMGWKVIRFWNKEVDGRIAWVAVQIALVLERRKTELTSNPGSL